MMEIAMPAAQTTSFAGFVFLDQSSRRLIDKVRSELLEAGAEDLLAQLDALRPMTLFGRSIMRPSERDQLHDFLMRIHDMRKDEITIQATELKTLQRELAGSTTDVQAALADARTLTRDVKKLESKLDAALRRTAAHVQSRAAE